MYTIFKKYQILRIHKNDMQLLGLFQKAIRSSTTKHPVPKRSHHQRDYFHNITINTINTRFFQKKKTLLINSLDIFRIMHKKITLKKTLLINNEHNHVSLLLFLFNLEFAFNFDLINHIYKKEKHGAANVACF